jgi:tRNA A37 threonylcarbamoyladenosine dehydratase
MSQALITRSPDLARLRADGYELDVCEGKIVVTGVPFLDSQRRVGRGTLVSALVLNGDIAAAPGEHTIHWLGDTPHSTSGQPLQNNGPGTMDLGDGPVPALIYSRKPLGDKYDDFYEKITAYVRYISGPARAVDPSATAQTYRPIQPTDEDSVFCYLNTAIGRGGIEDANRKLKGHRIAIVGTGGTGAYVFDFVAKAEVAEIHLFDGDVLHSHNAFRAPGAASIHELREAPKKVHWLAGHYSNIRHHLHPHPYDIGGDNIDELRNMDFVFLCIDAGQAKSLIVDKLLEFTIPFIDVGMGLRTDAGVITGRVRVTTSTRAKHDHVLNRISRHEPDPDEYRTNIQVVELNALNAALAVIRWKQYLGFYADEAGQHHSLYVLPTNTVLNVDLSCPE